MKKKKETRDQLERRINNAIVFVPKDKESKTIYFSERGLRLTVTSEAAVIETGFHRHVFSNVTASGISRPFLYTRRLIEIANENDCKTEDGYSFAKLLEVLKAKEDQAEYNLAVYTEWWIFNCFQPLFSIGESAAESWLVYEAYLHNIARNAVILSEKTEDMTNKQFLDAVIKNMQEFTAEVDERVIFPKKTDEERIKEEIAAIQETENEQVLNTQKEG